MSLLQFEEPPLETRIISPVKCVKNEIHNILTVIRLTRNRKSKSQGFDREFQKLLDSLSFVDEFVFKPSHLGPFISVIESAYTNGPLTAVALSVLDKFVGYNLIRPNYSDSSETINALANGALKCKFISTQGPNDEVVFLKIITVLMSLIRCPAAGLIEDETLWGMVKTCFNIARMPSGSYLLASAAENALQQLTLFIFSSTSAHRINAQYWTLFFLSHLISMGQSSLTPLPPSDSPSSEGDDKCREPESRDLSIVEEFKYERDGSSSDVELQTMGLTLLNVALETGGHLMVSSRALRCLIEDQICHALLFNSRSASLLVVSLTLRCVFNLFTQFRPFLKIQLEVFLNSIHLRLVECRDRRDEMEQDLLELALESLVEFCREPKLMAELYLNYDCDVHSTNLFQEVVTRLCNQAAPQGFRAVTAEEQERPNSKALPVEEGPWSSVERSIMFVPKPVSGHNLLAFEGLLAVLENYLRPGTAEDIEDSMSTDLLMKKKRKTRLETAARIFNTSPSDMVAALQQLGVFPSRQVDAHAVANFLRSAPGLEMTAVGEYLAKGTPFNSAVRTAFVDTFAFEGQSLTQALREYLNSFKLPGESQLIERLMESFSQCYFTKQEVHDPEAEVTLPPTKTPRTSDEIEAAIPLYTVRRIPPLRGAADESPVLFYSSDCVFVLAYSIIMLQTDLHNAQVLNKMTQEEFVKRLAGINEERDIASWYLDDIYQAILAKPIKLAGQSIQTSEIDPEDSWELVMKKRNQNPTEYFVNPSGYDHLALTRDMVTIMTQDGHVLQALTQTLLSCTDLEQCRRVLKGFEILGEVAGSTKLVGVFNETVLTLTGFVNPWFSARSLLALPVLAKLVKAHVPLMRTQGWTSVVRVLLLLNAYNLLPRSFRDLDDFQEKEGRRASLNPPNTKPSMFMRSRDDRNKGAFRWLVQGLFSKDESDEEENGEDIEDALLLSLKSDAPNRVVVLQGWGANEKRSSYSDFKHALKNWKHHCKLFEKDIMDLIRLQALPQAIFKPAADLLRPAAMDEEDFPLNPEVLKALDHPAVALQEYWSSSFDIDAEITFILRHVTGSSTMSLGLSLLSYVAAPAPMKVHQQLDRSLRQPPAWDFAPLISVRPKDVSAYRASVDSLIALEYLVSLLCHQYLVPNSSPMTSDNLPPLALWRLTLFQIESLLRTYLPGGSKLETDTVPGVEETFRQAYKATTGVDAEQLPESLLSVLPEVVRLEKLDGRALIFVERLLVASLKLVYRCADADVPAYMSSSLVALLCNVVYIHPALIVLNRERLVSAVTSICSDVSSAFHKLTFADGRSTMRAPADVIQGLLLRCAPLELPTFRLSQQAMFSLPNHGHGSTEQFTLSVEHSLKLANSIDWASPGAARLLQAAISTVTAHLIGGLDDASAELAVLVVHSLQALSALAALTTSLPDPGCERMICLSVVAVAVAASRLSSEAYQHRAVSAVTACATHLISKASDLGDDIHLRSAILRTALLPALLNEAVSPLSEAFASEASLVWNGDAPPLERAWMAGDVSESIFLLLSQQSPLDSVRQRASIASVTFRMALCILDSCTKLLLSGEDQESWEPCIMSTLDCLVLVVDALVELIKDERVPGEHTEAFLEYLKNLLLVFSTSPLVCDFDDGLRGGHCSFEGQRLVVQAVEGLADRLQVTTASVSDPLSLVKEQPQAQQRTKLELSVRLLSIMSHLIGPSLSPVVLRDSVVLLLENTAQPPEPASPERGSEQRPPPPPEDPPANLSDEPFDDAPAFSNEPHADPSQPPPAGTHAGVAWPVIDGEPTDLPAETEVTDKNTK